MNAWLGQAKRFIAPETRAVAKCQAPAVFAAIARFGKKMIYPAVIIAKTARPKEVAVKF